VIEFSKILKVNPKKINIKNLKNRWGSITKERQINLNLNLIKAPEDVIDYIIIHELCHFKVKGHSHKFWTYLHKYIPNYEDKVNWLAINGSNILS
jgi:predicted metal-dependent hydrolase